MTCAQTFVLESLDRRLHLTAVVEEPQPSMVIQVEGNHVSVALGQDAPDQTAFLSGEPSAVVNYEWAGQQIEMRRGEWIVGLVDPGSTYDEDTGYWRFNGVPSRATTPTASLKAAIAEAESIGITLGRYIGSEDAFLIHVPDGVTYEQLLDAIDDIPDFRYVEPNFIMRAMPVLDVDPTAPDAREPATEGREPTGTGEFMVSRDAFRKTVVRGGGDSTWDAFNADDGDDLLSEPSPDPLY